MTSRAPLSSYQSLPLTLLSWNISNARPSASAPDFARRAVDAPRLIRDECLLASRARRPAPPDVIALQECPHPSFGTEEFGPAGYVSVGSRASHCGYVDLLVREELRPRPLPIPAEYNLPSVAAAILVAPPRSNGENDDDEATPVPPRSIAVSSSHLAPFKENALLRLMQCTALMDLLAEESDDCVHLGDFNMRAAEDAGVEGACGGGWMDAWKEAGDARSKFTWDSFANRYHGDDGFKFRARFDRCYVRGDGLTVRQFGLTGNQCVERKGDYLSDHFGLSVELDVAL